MSNAAIDQNSRATLTAISNADGSTIMRVTANPTSNYLRVIDGTTGTDLGNNGGNAMIDENSRQVMTALSSAGDGTLVELYLDNDTQSLLINSL